MDYKKIAIVSAVASALLPIIAHGADLDATATSGFVTTAIGNLSTILSTSIPTILVVAVSLVGVMILWRFLRRTVK